jgi:hypothetical protein
MINGEIGDDIYEDEESSGNDMWWLNLYNLNHTNINWNITIILNGFKWFLFW